MALRTRVDPRKLLPWLMPPILLGAVLLGAAIVLRAPVGLFGVVAALLFGATLLWIVVSVLWPAHADRRCTECGVEALERLDPKTTRGLRCRACGWSDETKSGWFLAEDEGTLEDIVLRERDRAR